MLCSERVIAATAALTGLTESELNAYAFLIENAVSGTQALLRGSDDSRGVALAAAKAAYEIALVRYGGGFTDFKAGDVSFSVNPDAVANAKRVYENALADCRDCVSDSGFVFKTV